MVKEGIPNIKKEVRKMKEITENGKLIITVKDRLGEGVPIFDVPLSIFYKPTSTTRKAQVEKLEDSDTCFEGTPKTSEYEELVGEHETKANGEYIFPGPAGLYIVVADVHGFKVWCPGEIQEGCVKKLLLLVPIDLKVEPRRIRDCKSYFCDKFVPGETA